MFDTIILLTEPVEQPALCALLCRHNPYLTIHPVATLTELEAVAPARLARARLVGFVTPVVVPARILDALAHGAYNFHPGPPHYPGWVPTHFAVYDGARLFGATAHVMVERVDAGPIVGVDWFAVPPGTRVMELQERAFIAVARLFWRLAEALATRSEPLPVLPVAWSGRHSTRRRYAAMCEIAADIGKEELDRRIAVFGAGHFGLAPTLTLHGHRFRYVAEGTETAVVDSPGVVPAAETAPAVPSTNAVREPTSP